MVVAWVLFPLVLVAVCLGCGLLLERVGGWSLPGALLPAVGLAVIIAVATLTTSLAGTAPLTTPAVVVVALAGYGTSWPRLRALRPESWAVALGLGVFAVCAAPVVGSGNATFLGYFVDSDPAFHFALISHLLAHGADLTNVPSVSVSAVPNLLHEYIGTAYPTGADVALGAVRPLVGQDVAWIFQPYLAVIMAFGALALHELLRGVVTSRPLRAVCAFIAAQGGLAYGFYLEASIKEIATTLIITVTVVLVLETLRRPLRLRAFAPLAIVAVAGLDVLAVAVVPWLGPPLAVFAVIVAWRVRHQARRMPTWRTAGQAGGGVLIIAALAAPIISGFSTFAGIANAVLSQKTDLGNLAAPLQDWQTVGIWPTGDFRYPVETHYRVAYALMGVSLISAALGTVWTVRRRAFGPLLLLVSGAIAAVFLLDRSSPYAASKVLMIFSIAVVMAAMLGAAALHDVGRRLEGWGLAVVIAAGVLWTNALAYHDSSVAPQGRFRELASIDARFSGHGPAFYDLWDTFPVYFLRDVGVAVPDTWAGPAPLRTGLPPRVPGQLNSPWDPNNLDPAYLQRFPLLVLGRSPALSRPPADYRLAHRGRYYDVWQRTATPHVLADISLSTGGLNPAPRPSCQSIKATAARAQHQGDRLAYVLRPSVPALIPTQAAHTPTWNPTTASGDAAPDILALSQQAGGVTGLVRVSTPGRYAVWVQGSLSRRVTVWVGRRFVGSIVHQVGSAGQFTQVGTVDLGTGDQPVQVLRPPADLSPGNVGSDLLGPVELVRDSAPVPVRELAPGQARSLCGKPLEWIEIVS